MVTGEVLSAWSVPRVEVGVGVDGEVGAGGAGGSTKEIVTRPFDCIPASKVYGS
jgi:hypothetical protein